MISSLYHWFIGVAYAQCSSGNLLDPQFARLRNELGTRSGFYNPICPTTTTRTVGQVVDLVITILLYTAGILATIYLVYSGILYITSAGDETKTTKARGGILNAIIGIIIILLAFVIEKAVARIFT